MKPAQAAAMVCDMLSGSIDAMLVSMSLGELLMAIPRVGEVKLREWFRWEGPSLSRKLGNLTDREKSLVCATLTAKVR